MASFDMKTALVALLCFTSGMLFQFFAAHTITNGILPSYSTISTTSYSETVHTKCTFNATSIRESHPTSSPYRSDPKNRQSTTSTPLFTTPSSTPVVKAILPPALHPDYTQNNVQFNITHSMLRRSRPIIGNTQRWRLYLQKLDRKECTVVLFLGGSVTDGHHVKGRSEEAYPAHFMNWLNTRFPCFNDGDGSAGKHVMKKTHAQNSQTHFVHWSVVSEIERIDLVLIEFNVNDSFISDLPHALEDKGEDGRTRQYADLWYSEVLLRRLLLLRKPDPLAIITFNADYVGASWAKPPHGDPAEDRKRLFRRNEEPMKLWISSLYEIPVISASIWMLPLASKLGTDWQFNKTDNPYSTARWHADRCCHPRKEGHRILAMVLIYNFVQEEKDMSQAVTETVADIERDYTLQGVMRDPIYLSSEEESLYVLNKEEARIAFDIDFTDPKGWDKWNSRLVVNDGPWRWDADNVDQDKFGLIANKNVVGEESHISIEVVGGKFGLIEVSYVVSYENFGISLAWVDNVQRNSMRSQCNNTINGRIPVDSNTKGVQRLVAIWSEPASVPRVQLLHTDLTQGQKRFFHVCLTPKGKHVNGTENKFKLLGIRSY